MLDHPPESPSNREKINLEEALASKELELGNVEIETSNDDTELNLHKTMNNSPEIVNLVEKISGILSPYFIVLVGLFLYDSNVLIGTILIFIGIFSLLKLSWQDIQGIIEKIKNFFATNS
ncbi:MAG: hypothetical protein ACRC6M_04895 [Microcystaceae cyanobacterium]